MLRTEFFHECYLRTGWIPMQPLSRQIKLGDVCQIQHGRFQALLNLDQIHLAERALEVGSIHLNPIDWRIKRGVQQTECQIHTDANKAGEQYQWTEQVLQFAQAGSFLFHGSEPHAQLLLNWNQIRDDVTLNLTQQHYSFRHVYVVTAVASMKDWGLTISGQEGGHLEMSAGIGNTDSFAMLSHSSAQTAKCRGIAYNEQANGQPAHFFKAKKLVMSDGRMDHFLRQVVENKVDLSEQVKANWLNADLMNLLKANELNLATCHNFFSWVDASLDDVALLID